MNESTLVPREEMSDLDWLASNVHVWPSKAEHVIVREGGILDWFQFGLMKYKHEKHWFNRKQCLARRAELQNKPSWGTHEYKVIVQGRNGCWYGSNCSEEKFGHEGSFCITGTGWKYICYGVDLGDWRDTLEKRPEQKVFEPLASVEDEATSKQHDPVSNPSHYASGGIECIEAIKASMSHEAFLGYLKGNVQKYTWRYEKKVNPAEDLKKARWYLDKLIEEQK